MPVRSPSDSSIFSAAEWELLAITLKLSPRQTEVLQLLFDGCSDGQIAQKLAISEPTVRTHLQRLFAKCHVHDRTALAIHVFRQFRNDASNRDDDIR